MRDMHIYRNKGPCIVIIHTVSEPYCLLDVTGYWTFRPCLAIYFLKLFFVFMLNLNQGLISY